MVPIYTLLYILVIKVVERVSVSELNNIYMFVLVSSLRLKVRVTPALFISSISIQPTSKGMGGGSDTGIAPGFRIVTVPSSVTTRKKSLIIVYSLLASMLRLMRTCISTTY